MRPAFILLAAIASQPALAAETAWQEIAPDVRARLISSDQRAADGTTTIALELDMPDSVKTYWRVPGETGIPIDVDITRSAGLAQLDIHWPYPVIDRQPEYLDYVYYGPTVLPMTVTLDGDTAKLDADVVLGVCSDVCVPARMSFALDLSFAAPDNGNALRIAQAMSRTPIDWQQDAGPVGEVGWSAADSALSVPIDAAQVDPASVIATVDDSELLFGQPEPGSSPGIFHFPLLGDPAAGLAGQTVELTFMTKDGPFQLARPVMKSP